MPGISKTAGIFHQPRRFSRRGVLIASFTSLLIALALSFAWQDRILSHLHYEPAKTEILKIELQEPYSEFSIQPAPATKSMPGGAMLLFEG